MNRSADHLARETYCALVDVLEDLQLVTRDIRAAAAGQLLVRSDDLDFLTRRADYLAAGAVDYIRELQVIPHDTRHLGEVTES